MSIKTEHRGYTISYSENNDTWGCYEAGVHNQATLGKAKEAINRLHLAMRKKSALPCYEMRGSESLKGVHVEITPATVIEYLGPKKQRVGLTRDYEVVDHTVASVAKRSGSSQKSRSRTYLSRLCPDTDEVHVAIFEANELGRVAHEAMTAFREAVAAIPRVALEDLGDLIDAGEARLEE